MPTRNNAFTAGMDIVIGSQFGHIVPALLLAIKHESKLPQIAFPEMAIWAAQLYLFSPLL